MAFPSSTQSCPDQFFSPGHCFPFARSVAFCHELSLGREQFNGITAFVDASNVYGSGVATAELLREFEGGRLLEGKDGTLPLLDDGSGIKEERAGDVRARENPGVFMKNLSGIALQQGLHKYTWPSWIT